MCFVVPIAEFPKRQKKHSFFGNLAGEGVFFMLLNDVREEFAFHCQCRNLSPRTIKNYGKQIDYLIRFLQGKGIEHVQDVEPRYIKAFLLEMKQTGHTPNYINDLLKAYKVFFRYAYNEGYTETLLTEKIQNVKAPKVIIRTFSEQELKKLSNYYQGYDYLNIRNKVKQIANSKETIVRFQGDHYHYDLTVKSSDKTAINQVLTAYEALKNDGLA